VQLDTLVDRFPIIREENFMLSSRRWTRFGGAGGNSLKHLVELELRGLPVHAWETSVVQQLINPHACISQVLPDTLDIQSLEVFRCLAWCCDPERIPSMKDLWITEPDQASAAEGKKALVYPVQIRWVPADLSLLPGAPLQPVGGDDQDKSDTPPSRRRCDDNLARTQHDAINDVPGNKTHTQRRPVHDRLGPLRPSDSPRELSHPRVLIDTEARSSQPCILFDAMADSCVGNPPTPVPVGVQCMVAGDVLLRREEGCEDAEVIPMTPMAVSSPCPSSGVRHRLMLKTATKQAKFRNPPIAFFRRRQRAPRTPEGATLPPCSSGDRGAGSSLGALPPAPAAGVAGSPLSHGPPPLVESHGSLGQQDFLRQVSKAVGAVLPLPRAVGGGRRRRQPTSPPDAIRRSRRVAGLGVEQVQHIPKARRTIMKSILAEPDSEHFSQQNLDAYAKLFQAPLSRAQVEALAALFGWVMPDDDGEVVPPGTATLVC
jgi:hypothetical protein